MPMQSAPRDALRQGLGSLKDDVAASHPVYTLQQNVCSPGLQSSLPSCSHTCPFVAHSESWLVWQYPEEQWQTKERMMQSVYGTALPAKMKIERQILGRSELLSSMDQLSLVCPTQPHSTFRGRWAAQGTASSGPAFCKAWFGLADGRARRLWLFILPWRRCRARERYS